jgi:hypothetical protein
MTTNHVVKRVRDQLRNALFDFVRRLADTDDARTTGISVLEGMLMRRGLTLLPELPDDPPDYPELGRARKAATCQRDDIIFITGRFRSGSTLLWNIFRNIEGMTAYYEPLNERRWFDRATRGVRVDSTHRKVDDYWREYEGLNELAEHYQLAWIDRRAPVQSRRLPPAVAQRAIPQCQADPPLSPPARSVALDSCRSESLSSRRPDRRIRILRQVLSVELGARPTIAVSVSR